MTLMVPLTVSCRLSLGQHMLVIRNKATCSGCRLQSQMPATQHSMHPNRAICWVHMPARQWAVLSQVIFLQLPV